MNSNIRTIVAKWWTDRFCRTQTQRNFVMRYNRLTDDKRLIDSRTLNRMSEWQIMFIEQQVPGRRVFSIMVAGLHEDAHWANGMVSILQDRNKAKSLYLEYIPEPEEIDHE